MPAAFDTSRHISFLVNPFFRHDRRRSCGYDPTILSLRLAIGQRICVACIGLYHGCLLYTSIPCILLIFIIDPIQSIYFAIFVLVLQQFDGNILGPKILGESTGLASFWVLFSIILFGGLFGFAGMVLGVPVFAMIYSIIRRLVCYGLRRHKLPTETEVYMGRTGPMSLPNGHKE